ncbi:MAG: DUF484 family protein [Burkholderiales bacterium]
MNSEDVATYLKEHPAFFEEYAEMMSEIHIPHPHGGRTIPISERQILTLREKSKQLEGKLREIIQFGEDNDAISEKMHRITLALLGAKDIAATVHATEFNLREDFLVPHVVLRLWRGAGDLSVFQPASEATCHFAAGLAHPHCCSQAAADTAELFGESAPLLKSFAYVGLRDGDCFGLVALASEDPHRFYPEMGTIFLSRLGDIIAAALARHLV